MVGLGTSREPRNLKQALPAAWRWAWGSKLCNELEKLIALPVEVTAFQAGRESDCPAGPKGKGTLSRAPKTH